MKLSVIIPVYNEKLLIREIISRCLEAPLPEEFTDREIIVVDDGSSDGTTELLKKQKFGELVKIHHSYVNHGKGCALRVGFKICTGDVIIIQDGDLEYDPLINYRILLMPFTARKDCLVVFGSRFLTHWWPRGMRLPNLFANYVLTIITRFLYGYRISDEATCYKVFRREILKRFTFYSRGFEFCPEFTAKIIRSGIIIKEVPIQYNGRSQLTGKKIKVWDGFIALWILFKFRIKPNLRKNEFIG